MTYFVAMPFVRAETGDLVAGEAVERLTATEAIRAAMRMSAGAAGAVAFSRTGDRATGEFEDAKVIGIFGDVPTRDQLLSAD